LLGRFGCGRLSDGRASGTAIAFTLQRDRTEQRRDGGVAGRMLQPHEKRSRQYGRSLDWRRARMARLTDDSGHPDAIGQRLKLDLRCWIPRPLGAGGGAVPRFEIAFLALAGGPFQRRPCYGGF
jgi:hypothetical protein